jgi:hypothetical protein
MQRVRHAPLRPPRACSGSLAAGAAGAPRAARGHPGRAAGARPGVGRPTGRLRLQRALARPRELLGQRQGQIPGLVIIRTWPPSSQ